MPNKQAILEALIMQLEQSLSIAIDSAKHAHQDATHEQSKAETQYDSLGIEMAYLAEGQSKRIDSLRQELQVLKALTFPTNNETVQLGHLVRLTSETSRENDFAVLILPVAGVNHVSINELTIQVVTPNAPIAVKLLKQTEEEIVTLPWMDDAFEITEII